MASFFKTDKDKLIFTGDGELIYYIPENFFTINAAMIFGEKVKFIGICSYGLYDKNGKEVLFKQLKAPTMIECIPSSISKESNLHLKGTHEAKAYRLLHFKKNDELICSLKVAQDVENVEKFSTMLTRANLPETIPYNELHNYMLENARLNGFNYKVSPQLMGMLISELCRDPEDLSRPFRYTDMKNMNAYKAISILQVPKYTSPYTAITSENGDEAIAAAMTVKSNTVSPLEKIMMESASLDEEDFFEESVLSDDEYSRLSAEWAQ